MSAFDPAMYEQMALEQANETTYTPIPDGDYESIIDTAKVEGVQRKDGSMAAVLRVTHNLVSASDELKKLLNRDKVTIRQDIWLDTNENGALAFGPNQNVRLGQLRQELGMNTPGKKFMLGMLSGAGPLKVKVTSKEATDGSGKIYNNADIILTKKK